MSAFPFPYNPHRPFLQIHLRIYRSSDSYKDSYKDQGFEEARDSVSLWTDEFEIDKADEEIVLEWEWDDTCAVHMPDLRLRMSKGDMLTTCACNPNINLSTPTQWGQRSDEGNGEFVKNGKPKFCDEDDDSEVDAVGSIDEEAKGPEWEIVQADRDVDVDLDIAPPPPTPVPRPSSVALELPVPQFLQPRFRISLLEDTHEPEPESTWVRIGHLRGFPTWEREKGSTVELEND
ncbi:hypothetical protein GG344DRAFT_64217 [Lentinula edodes]|nr:hypothetical protein GG344DRAFT_64217 [Lentinula edodes]